ATLPVLSTKAATDVKGELATSGGNITDDGGAPITRRGVCWNTTGTPTTGDAGSTDGRGPGSFQSTLVNLAPNTGYYYRAYAINKAGTAYGEVKQLTTGAVALPTVTTAAISSVFSYKATGGGTITSDGNAMTVLGLCWNTTGDPTIADNKTICGSGAGFHAGTMAGLTENFKYYVRAYATNSVGTVYGDQITFATPFSTNLSKPIGFAEGTTGGGTPTADNTITVTTAAALAAAITGSKSVILVSGTITTGRISGVFTNRSIIGLPGARLINLDQTKSGSGIFFLTEGSRNVIIQNLTFEGPGAYDVDGYDLLSNKGCYKLWVDHCEFQDGTDGNFDNSGDADSITVSWCKFTYLKPPRAGGPGGSPDHRFSNLIGGSDSDAPQDAHYSTTWQNCWWAPGVKARMVRARNGEIHLLNCYWNSPETADAIGITAGTFGTTVYVEGGVFNIPATGKVADLGPGAIAIKFQDCIGGSANYGSVNPPPYEYTAMPSGEVVAAITNASCGAGATLFVTGTGEVYSSCPSVPILSATGKLEQEVFTGKAIEDVVFTWSGTATDVSIASLPAGLISEKNAVAKTLTISGIPTAPGTCTVSTIGGVGLPATKQATITITHIAPAALSYAGNLNQTVNRGSAISNIVFTWSGGATDVSVYGLPAGVNSVKDQTAKTLTISGIPTLSGMYTVSTVGGSGHAVTYQGTVNVVVDPALHTLTSTGSRDQTVVSGAAISNIIFTWGGGATDVTVTQLPAGLTGSKEAAGKTLTISGIPTASGSFTVTTLGGSKPAVSLQGTVNVSAATPTLAVTDYHTQTVIKGIAIKNIVFTWGGGATGVNLSDLPAGLVSSSDDNSKTLTISGTPMTSGTYSVTTTGGAAPAITLQGTITIAKGIEEINMRLNPSLVTHETVLFFHGNMAQTGVITVVDSYGKTVLRKTIDVIPGKNECSIPMGRHRPGIYICTLQIEGKAYFRKLVKL
ncbi:MAG TPA: hypothetical protein VF008_06710, partial [Niastella sp.]